MRKNEDLSHPSIVIKRKKNTKKAKKKLEKEIQGAVKTKRKVSNLLKKFESLNKKSSTMEETGSSSKASKRSKKAKSKKKRANKNAEDEDQENNHVNIDLASSDSNVDDEVSSLVEAVHSINVQPHGAYFGAEISSADDEEASIMELEVSDSEDSISTDPAVHPSMKKFENKIYYRKLDSHSLLVSINPFNSLYFSGKFSIKVLKGAVEICGYQMTRNHQTRQAFSPKGNSSLLYIRGVSRQCEFDTEEVTEEFQHVVPLEELEDLPGAVLVLKAFDNEWAQGLRHFLPHGESLVGPSITGIGSGKLPKMKTFMEKMGFQFIPQFMREKSRLFETSPAWEQVFGAITTTRSKGSDRTLRPRVCIFGGKGVGKSTFTRWMVNKLISAGNKSVLYIDLDPGQTEFTPPGVVSVTICEEPLLGPNFTHLRHPTRSIFLGGVNVSDFPVSYLNALVQLFEFASGDEQLASIPWVVNTMGYSQGLGVNLAVGCINIFQPSNVIQLSINNDRRSFPFNLNYHNVSSYRNQLLQKNMPRYATCSQDYKFFNVESVCNRSDGSNDSPWGGSPKSLRENMIASYFSEMIGSTSDNSFLSVLPCNISLKEITIGTMNSDLSYDGILRSIKGNLVALCECPSEVLEQDQNQQAPSNGQGTFITKLGAYSNTFYGYGIVRAVDEERKLLHVVTPLSDDLKTRVNVVVAAGNIGLPIEFFIGNVRDKSDVSQLEVPYVLNMREGKSKLHTASKKYFAQKRVTHSVLRNSLL